MTLSQEAIEAKMCNVHIAEEDDDCEHCKSFLAWLTKAYQERIDSNNSATKALTMDGFNLNYMEVMDMKISMMLDLLFQGRPSQRARFEIAFADNMAEMLGHAQSQAIKMKLAAGVQNTRLHMPNK